MARVGSESKILLVNLKYFIVKDYSKKCTFSILCLFTSHLVTFSGYENGGTLTLQLLFITTVYVLIL